jgi:quercetin dioxygenase-like cupin family protein
MEEQIWFGGGLLTFRVTSEQSAGDFVVVEDVMPKGKTTPLHLHPTFDETIYVADGELLVHLDGVEHQVSAGTVVTAPRGVAHAFLVTSDEARVLVFITPGDLSEAFFRAGGDPVLSPDDDPPPLDIAKVTKAGQETGGMQVLGPPPFAR